MKKIIVLLATILITNLSYAIVTFPSGTQFSAEDIQEGTTYQCGLSNTVQQSQTQCSCEDFTYSYYKRGNFLTKTKVLLYRIRKTTIIDGQEISSTAGRFAMYSLCEQAREKDKTCTN